MQLRKTLGIVVTCYCCLSMPVFANDNCSDEPKVVRPPLAVEEEEGFRPLTSEELQEQQDSVYTSGGDDSGYRQRSTSSKDCEPQKSLVVIEERGYRPLHSSSQQAQPDETQAPAQPGYAPQGYAPQGYAPQGYAPQGYAPQGYAPQGYAPQGYAPQGYAPYYPQPGYWPGAAASSGFYPGMMYGNPYANPWQGGGGYPYGAMPRFIPGYGAMPYSFGGYGTAPY